MIGIVQLFFDAAFRVHVMIVGRKKPSGKAK
jgi:hypothetical protein